MAQIIHRLSTACGFFVCGYVGKFSPLRQHIRNPWKCRQISIESYRSIYKHILNLIECDQNLPEFVRIFLRKSIDNVGKICSLRGYWQNPWNMQSMSICLQENLTLRPSYESAQLDIYIFIYNTITNLIVSIVNILHYAPLYSTIEAF